MSIKDIKTRIAVREVLQLLIEDGHDIEVVKSACRNFVGEPEDAVWLSNYDASLKKKLANIEEGLNDWELGFVVSVLKQQYPMTEDQIRKAEEIIAETT